MSKPFKRKGKRYRVGQVVSIETTFYRSSERVAEKYQRITKIAAWPLPFGGDCLTFVNGDKCHEKWVRPLRGKEIA